MNSEDLKQMIERAIREFNNSQMAAYKIASVKLNGNISERRVFKLEVDDEESADVLRNLRDALQQELNENIEQVLAVGDFKQANQIINKIKGIK